MQLQIVQTRLQIKPTACRQRLRRLSATSSQFRLGFSEAARGACNWALVCGMSAGYSAPVPSGPPAGPNQVVGRRCRLTYCRSSPFLQKRKKKESFSLGKGVSQLFSQELLYTMLESCIEALRAGGASEDKCIHGRGVQMLWPYTHQLD